MPALPSDLRKQLENVCIAARDVAEAAARSALSKRAVDASKPFDHFTKKDRDLRNRLRARGRQAGDVRDERAGTQSIEQLTQELAYEYWHRMLFARFLAENHLLMHPEGVAVSLDECHELAKSEGAPNGFVLAARYASRMLPQVFRTDDVLLEIEFAPEQRLSLEKLLASLPRQTFLADDSLGWVYQFWQTKKKEQVNKSGDKIDGHTLPAVTQLFTEDYMVQFLLHNTIGAWWAGRHLNAEDAESAESEEALRDKLAVPGVAWEYLRFVRDDAARDPCNPKSKIKNQKSPWRPAAGSFDGWPASLAEFTMLGPCCGSGHFLVNAFNLLVPLRMHDEGLPARESCHVVLRDNLFGLELDQRCTQIAAFALALVAWKHPDEHGEALGYRELPPLKIACSGQTLTGEKDEWLALTNGDSRLREGMENLYVLFRQAPHIGSLINPRREKAALMSAGFLELQPLLVRALSTETIRNDADYHAIGVAAEGIATAAHYLSGSYTLVCTNVPYLGLRDQSEIVRKYFATHFPDSLADLATCFLERCVDLIQPVGSLALVTPQNWLFLKLYQDLRKKILRHETWNFVARLGPRAFETISGEVVNVALLVIDGRQPPEKQRFAAIDVSKERAAADKANVLRTAKVVETEQKPLLKREGYRIVFGESYSGDTIQSVAHAFKGLGTGDDPRFRRFYWEFPSPPSGWKRLQSSIDATVDYGGCESLVWLDAMTKPLQPGVYMRGEETWGKRGVLVRLVGHLPCCLSVGEAFDQNVALLLPRNPKNLPALWAYCKSDVFEVEVRKLDQKLNVTTGTLEHAAFDLEVWRKVAEVVGAVPDPYSLDVTQWLFAGTLTDCTEPLHAGLGRLLGYRWPEQPETNDALDSFGDTDGIVCIPAVRGEEPAAERVIELLHVAYGRKWSNSVLYELLTTERCKPGTNLDERLRSLFFEHHCRLFHNRPFIWHIWDGRKDGFSCLVNYHTLDHVRLESLTYSYLGDWIQAQNADAKAGKPGADLRLAAAQALQEKLKLILAGEPPYDIFVRWKPLSQQAIGWHPDLNDGVRMNIRPFVKAGVLRKNPNIKWTKDRGKEPERPKDEYPWFWNGSQPLGDRVNDVHLTNAEKLAVRKTGGE